MPEKKTKTDNTETDEPKSKDDLRREHIERQKKTVKKRKIATFAVILLVTLFICSGLGIMTFRVKKVTVKGNGAIKSEAIVKAAGINVDESLFLVDTNSVIEKLKEKFPTIDTVTVEKSFNGEVAIKLSVGTVKYALKNADKFILLSNSGKVVKVADTKPSQDITVIYTEKQVSDYDIGEKKITFEDEKDGESATFNSLSKLLNAIEAIKLDGITEINLKKLDSITMVYRKRIVIKFGDMENFEKKLKLTAKALAREDEISSVQKGTLDLSIDGKAFFSPESK